MRKRLIVIIGGLLIATVGGIGYVIYSRNADLKGVDAVISAVGRHYVLPTGEEPALATVEDKTKLNSEFLRAAENGDRLLVYKDAKKVILYRPGIDRIIEVGPVSIAPAEGTSSK